MIRIATFLGLSLMWHLPALHAQPVTLLVDTQNSVISYTGNAIMHNWTGVSRSVTGTLAIDMVNPANSRIELWAPIESFDSGNSNRDSNMLDAVEVEKYPTVRFVSTQVATGAEPGTWQVSGDLTLHGQTLPIELPVQVAYNNGRFEARGAFETSMTQFGIRRPRVMLARVGDVLRVEFTIQTGT
jgi:polyisoprenoid-binding protein YceI